MTESPVDLVSDYPCLANLPALLGGDGGDRGELLDVVLEFLVRDSGAARGTIYLVDRERQELNSTATRGREIEGLSLPVGEGVAGNVARSGELQIISDAYASPLFDRSVDELTGFRTENMLTAPIGVGEAVGVIQLLNKPRGFTERDAAFVATVASQLAGYLATS